MEPCIQMDRFPSSAGLDPGPISRSAVNLFGALGLPQRTNKSENTFANSYNLALINRLSYLVVNHRVKRFKCTDLGLQI